MADRILAIALSPALAPGLAAAAAAAGGREVLELSDARSALDLFGLETPAAIVARYPLPDLPLAEFCMPLRIGRSPWREVPLLLVAPAARRAEAEAWVGRGATRVVDENVEPHGLVAEILRLGLKAHRRPLPVLVRLHLEPNGRGREPNAKGKVLLGGVENVSSTGLLVRTPHVFAVGTRLAFELPLPGDGEPLHGEAKVVRLAVPERDGLAGCGLRFLAFEGDGKRRLQAWMLRPGAGG